MDKQLAHAQRLLDEAFVMHQRLGEKLDEIDRVLQKQPTPGQHAKRVLDFFAANWERKYHTKLIVNGAKDMATFKRLLTNISATDLAERVRRYFRQVDPFVTDAKHSIGVFASRVNELAAPAAGTHRPIGCSHTPPCADEVSHTTRYRAEQRTTS